MNGMRVNTTMEEGVTIRIAIRSITASYTKDGVTKIKLNRDKTTIKITDSGTAKHRTIQDCNTTRRRTKRTKTQITKPRKPHRKLIRRKRMSLLQTNHGRREMRQLPKKIKTFVSISQSINVNRDHGESH